MVKNLTDLIFGGYLPRDQTNDLREKQVSLAKLILGDMDPVDQNALREVQEYDTTRATQILLGVYSSSKEPEKSRIDNYFEVRDRLIEGNLGIVGIIFSKHGFDALNETQVLGGIQGLIVSIEKFNPAESALSTYAENGIKWKATRVIPNIGGTHLHVPPDTRSVGYRLHNIFGYTGFSDYTNIDLERISKQEEIPLETIKEFIRLRSIQMLHLDEQVNQNPCETWHEYSEIGVKDPESEIVGGIHTEEILQIGFQALTKRERDIITKRYGLNGGEKQSLEEISKVYGVTKQAISQIEFKALEKMCCVA